MDLFSPPGGSDKEAAHNELDYEADRAPDVVGCDAAGTSWIEGHTMLPYYVAQDEFWYAGDGKAGIRSWGRAIATSVLSSMRSQYSHTRMPPTRTTAPAGPSVSDWYVVPFASPSCNADAGAHGDYYVLTGPALPVSWDWAVQCIAFPPADIPDAGFDGTRNSCRYFTNGGTEFSDCSEATLDDFSSWRLRSGMCQVYDHVGCPRDKGAFSYYMPEGCHEYGAYDYEDIRPWRSMKCYRWDPSAEAAAAESLPLQLLSLPSGSAHHGGNNETTSSETSDILPYPRNTAVDSGQALCWGDYKDLATARPRYRPFSRAAARDAVAAFCTSRPTLRADGGARHRFGQAHAVDNATTVYAEMRWAADQRGCGSPRQDLALFADVCLAAFDTAFFRCES